MKALTIIQPYAELIADGEKMVENRTWYTNYRGPLAIHAGKSREGLSGDPGEELLIFGAVVAIVDLTACLCLDRMGLVESWEAYSWVQRHSHTEGPFCWVLESVQRLEKPIAARGQQGLWNWDDPR